MEDKIYNYMSKVTDKILERLIKSNERYDKVTDIDIEEIKKIKQKYGIGGIILDVDGTVRKDLKDINEQNINWIKLIKDELKLCIVSNGTDRKILEMSKKLDIPYINFAKKPFKKSFLKAADIMGLNPENILVIGDEQINDIWGGKRIGMNVAKVKSLEFDDER